MVTLISHSIGTNVSFKTLVVIQGRQLSHIQVSVGILLALGAK